MKVPQNGLKQRDYKKYYSRIYKNGGKSNYLQNSLRITADGEATLTYRKRRNYLNGMTLTVILDEVKTRALLSSRQFNTLCVDGVVALRLDAYTIELMLSSVGA